MRGAAGGWLSLLKDESVHWGSRSSHRSACLPVLHEPVGFASQVEVGSGSKVHEGSGSGEPYRGIHLSIWSHAPA